MQDPTKERETSKIQEVCLVLCVNVSAGYKYTFLGYSELNDLYIDY